MIKFRNKKEKQKPFKFKLSDETKRAIEKSTGKSIEEIKSTPLSQLSWEETKEMADWIRLLSSHMGHILEIF